MRRRLSVALPTLLGLAAAAGPARGQAAFGPGQFYPSGSTYTYGVAVGDLNGDGRPDLAVSSRSGVGVLLASATTAGAFGAVTIYPVGGIPGPLVRLGDVNGDGRLDVVGTATNGATNRVVVLLGSAATPGTLLAATAYDVDAVGANPRGLDIGDVNGDGRPDLAVGSFNTGDVGVLLGLAAAPGTFGAVAAYVTGGSSNTAVAFADLTGDGRPDLVATDRVAGSVIVLPNLATATGTLGAAAVYAVGGSAPTPYGLAVGDVNGDGRPDVLTANVTSSFFSVLLNSAASPGTLLAPVLYNTGGSTPIELTLGDINNDGRPDVAVSNVDTNTVGLLLGSATAPGTFGVVTTYAVGAGPRSLVLADLNRDNKRDLVVANFGTNNLGVLLNQLTLTATPGLAAAAVALYPNPAHGSCEVRLPALAGAAAVQAALLDALGRPVRQLQAALPAPGSAFTLPTAGLPAGVYLLRLTVFDAQGTTLGTLPTQRLAVE